MRRYFERFLALSDATGLPLVLDTATWRANPDWGERLGYSRERLAEANRAAVVFARELAGGREGVVINGMLGPRGDGYVVGERMSAEEAEAYHSWQVGVLADAGVERITALTLTYPEEAIGVVRAAAARGLPVVPSFTLEVDGRLPSGEELGESIERVDRATGGAAALFMINCAHPTHFADVLADAGAWRERIGGLRANASDLSHAELDEAEELDEGDPAELARRHRELRERLPALEVLGGCCGTDHRHVEAIVAAWTAET